MKIEYIINILTILSHSVYNVSIWTPHIIHVRMVNTYWTGPKYNKNLKV
jgi:hypothetical protein